MSREAWSVRRKEATGLVSLTLAELEATASTRLAGLFAFLHARVACKEAALLERGTQGGFDHDKRTADRMADCTRLAVETAAVGEYFDVEIVMLGDRADGLQRVVAKIFGWQVILDRATIDHDFA